MSRGLGDVYKIQEKYSGTIDGTISDFIKIGWNRYLLVLDSGVDVIKLS